MNEKDLQKIKDLAKKELARVSSINKEEARQRLVEAGIFNKNGQYTTPYSTLAKAVNQG